MNRKILIIEDDVSQQKVLNAHLRANGYDTAFAGDAIHAVTIARKEKPDLVLLDIGLPAGDGFTVIQRLRRLADVAHVPIIVVSAFDVGADNQQLIDAEVEAVFRKPVNHEELLAAIERILAKA